MRQSDWADAGHGWLGKETALRLSGGAANARLFCCAANWLATWRSPITDHTNPAQARLGFAEVGPDKAVWEYAALITSLDNQILTLGPWYRDRADCENVFDEIKMRSGWTR